MGGMNCCLQKVWWGSEATRGCVQGQACVAKGATCQVGFPVVHLVPFNTAGVAPRPGQRASTAYQHHQFLAAPLNPISLTGPADSHFLRVLSCRITSSITLSLFGSSARQIEVDVSSLSVDDQSMFTGAPLHDRV